MAHPVSVEFVARPQLVVLSCLSASQLTENKNKQLLDINLVHSPSYVQRDGGSQVFFSYMYLSVFIARKVKHVYG